MAETTTTTKTEHIDPKDEKGDKYEIYTTILIGLATVLGALCAYYSALWGGESQTKYTLATNEQGKANTQYLEVLSDYTQFEMDEFKDDIIYAEWKNNVEKGDPDAEYYFTQLSEPFQKDLKDDPADVTNYEKEQAKTLADIEARFDESEARGDSAKLILQQGQDANGHGDKFTFATVLFTIVLFFGGLAALKTKDQLKKIYLIMATVVFLISFIMVITLPFP